MSKKVIAFFSSDAREKYKADIFRTLALPNKYVIHFRYQNQYIQPELLSNLSALKNKEGIIFYANGNDTSIDKEKRVIEFLSIRNVIIKDIYHDENLGLVNFYLELRDFVDCKFFEYTPKELVTPYLSVSEINVNFGHKNSWQDRVDLFQTYLKNTLFYYISSIKHGNSELEPKYSEVLKESWYKLDDETSYQMYFSFYDPSNGEYGLNINNTGDTVDINIPSEHKIGAPRETSIFELRTHTIQLQSTSGVTTYTIRSSSPEEAPDPLIDLSVQLNWKVYKKFRNILLFGLFTVLAVAGVAIGSIASKDLTTISFKSINLVLAFVSILLIFFAASVLFWMFNKK